VNDLKPFKHGSEGTHYACQNRIKTDGGVTSCCECVPHKNCNLLNTTPQPQDTEAGK
jgi:hypothetical protein